MAEVVGLVSSAITFATLALQVAKSVQTLKDYWDSMRGAPDDLKWLVRQIEVFGLIMTDIEADLSRDSISSAMTNSQHGPQSLQFCKEATEALDELCKELLRDVDSSSGLRRSYQAAKIVLRHRKIEKHISKLQNVVHLLMLSQQFYTRALLQVQPDLIAERMGQRGIVSSSTDTSKSKRMPHRLSKKKKRGDSRYYNYFWFLRGPNWMTSRVLEISGMKIPGGWDWSFRTYIEIPWSPEIDQHLKEGRINVLQSLFASRHLSPHVRFQGNGRSLLHYAVCVDRNDKLVDFLLDQGVDPSLEGEIDTLKTTLRLVLLNGKLAASNRLYPLLPYLRPLLRHSQDLMYDNAQEAVEGILSEFHGTSEEFTFLQRHCCPAFYHMPRWVRITVAAKIINDAPNAYHVGEANNTPDLIRKIIEKEILEAMDLQTVCKLPLSLKETTLMHCVTEKLGTSRAFLQMSSRRDLEIGNGYKLLTRPSNTHYHTKWKAICESWNGLFWDLLRVGVDFHQIIHGKTLFIAFLDAYLASQVSLPKSRHLPCFDQEDFHVGLRAWLKDVKAAGLDLERLGAKEWSLWRSESTLREFNGGLHRVTGIAYGPRPEDWYIWLSEPSDSFVGDFWASVARPTEIMPGEWPGEML